MRGHGPLEIEIHLRFCQHHPRPPRLGFLGLKTWYWVYELRNCMGKRKTTLFLLWIYLRAQGLWIKDSAFERIIIVSITHHTRTSLLPSCRNMIFRGVSSDGKKLHCSSGPLYVSSHSSLSEHLTRSVHPFIEIWPVFICCARIRRRGEVGWDEMRWTFHPQNNFQSLPNLTGSHSWLPRHCSISLLSFYNRSSPPNSLRICIPLDLCMSSSENMDNSFR